jgi:hypothetical protein
MSYDTEALLNDKTPIKYLLIGDSSTSKIITEFSSDNFQPNKKQINQIFNKLCKTPNKNLNERNKIKSKYENYYFTFCLPYLVYLILVSNEYAERYVFELIEKINEERIPTMINDDTKELNPNGRQALKKLINEFQDPRNISKLADLQGDVNSLKVDMRKSLHKMVENVDDVNLLQEKSEALKFGSIEYKDNSSELRRLTFWQNFKLWIILGGIILILIIILIWQIVS